MSLKETARQVLQIVDAGSYVENGVAVSFIDAQKASVEGTELFTPERLSDLRSQTRQSCPPAVAVNDGTTQVVAESMAQLVSGNGHHVALLNFAPARNPGGGFLGGAKAQEEDLAAARDSIRVCCNAWTTTTQTGIKIHYCIPIL